MVVENAYDYDEDGSGDRHIVDARLLLTFLLLFYMDAC